MGFIVIHNFFKKIHMYTDTTYVRFDFFRFGYRIMIFEGYRTWLKYSVPKPYMVFMCYFMIGFLTGCEEGFWVQSDDPPKAPRISTNKPKQTPEQKSPEVAPLPSPTSIPSVTPIQAIEILCKFNVMCATQNISLNIECKGSSPQVLSGPIPESGCEKIKISLHERGLPTGKTISAMEGGANASVLCEGSEGRLSLQSDFGGQNKTVLPFTTPAAVCTELRDIINGYKI
jgi:hypothetical protein